MRLVLQKAKAPILLLIIRWTINDHFHQTSCVGGTSKSWSLEIDWSIEFKPCQLSLPVFISEQWTQKSYYKSSKTQLDNWLNLAELITSSEKHKLEGEMPKWHILCMRRKITIWWNWNIQAQTTNWNPSKNKCKDFDLMIISYNFFRSLITCRERKFRYWKFGLRQKV